MPDSFGATLRALRLRAGWTQEALAERSGVSVHAISTLESGKRRPRLSSVAALADALGLDAADRERLAAVADPPALSDRPPASTPARAVPRMLPYATREFVGRGAELEALLALADDQVERDGPTAERGNAVVISAIDGMGGVGKTALAVQAAHRLVDRFPDGQLFVDLRGFAGGLPPQDPADVLAAILQVYGVSPGQIPADPGARAALYRNQLSGTRTLILLDNAASESQVRPLLPGTGSCLVLITSRKRLKALDDARTLPLDVLSLPEAVALLRQAAGADRLPADDPLTERIAEECGRLPLALRIAAALLRHRHSWTCERLLDALRQGRVGLKGFTDGDRHLAAVFDLSYQVLTPGQQQAFRRLALTPGPDCDHYALAALLDTDPTSAEDLLQDLVDHSLLSEPSRGRFRMHDLVREHAGTLAAADPAEDRDRSLGRLLQYYAHTAQAASQVIARSPRPAPHGPSPTHAPAVTDPDLARRWLRAELANLDAAFTHAHARTLHQPTIALAAGLAEILQADGPWPRALDIQQAAADTAEHHGDPEAHAEALADLGRARHFTGDLTGAGEAFARALEIYRALGNRRGEANVLTDLGRVDYLSGDYPEAHKALAQALEIYRALGNRRGEAYALTDLGNVRRMTGTYPEAGEAFDRALEIYRDLGHRHGEATVLIDLGNMRQTTGDYPGADDVLLKALGILRELGNRRGEATALTDLGRVRHLTGDYPGADDAHSQALELYRALGNRHGEANTLTGLGTVRHTAGDYAGAAEALARALEIFRELGHRGNEACALNYYAAALAATGQRPRALALYQQALAMNRELNKPDDEAISLEGIAEHHLATGQLAQGTAYLREALGIYRVLGMTLDSERAQTRLAELDLTHNQDS